MIIQKLGFIIGLILLFKVNESRGQNYQFVSGPPDKSFEAWQDWMITYSAWKKEIQQSFDLCNYDLPEVAWARTSFIQPQVMMHDRFLYDREQNLWTVEKFLDDLRERYGGVDSVLLWANYPNIGIDDRNQFDMMDSLPGGLEALAAVVEEFHRLGVRVLLPYNPWDQHTRPVDVEDYKLLVDIIVQTNSDGLNGDTMDGVNQTWWDQGLHMNHPLVMEPEVLMSNWSYLEYNLMSWAYWTPGAKVLDLRSNMLQDIQSNVGILKKREILGAPMIAAYKSVTDSKHMTHLTERWAMNHIDGIQQAFYNGIGFESWENVWGIWNGITERDAEALKRVSKIQRKFPQIFQAPGEYIPAIPSLSDVNSNIYASKFKYEDVQNHDNEDIYVLVNRNTENEETDILFTPCIHNFPDMVEKEMQIFDLYNGLNISSSCELVNGQLENQFSLTIEAGGFAAFYITTKQPNIDLLSFLEEMKSLTEKPLSQYDGEWKPLTQEMQMFEPVFEGSFEPNENTILVEDGTFDFNCTGTEIEGRRIPEGIDVQFPWEDHPQQFHTQTLDIPQLYVDKYPVTNFEYLTFIEESNWKPSQNQNWLRHWENGLYPEGADKQPVIWVSHADARAYCNFYGKRLPHSYEWQYFAQGIIKSGWPWGDNYTIDTSRMPDFTSGRSMPAPDEVDAHPDGASWAGIMDLVGNVYQWTDVFTDEHTSKAVLRGSSRWRPTGENSYWSWYLPLPYGDHWYPGDSEVWQTPGPLYEHTTLLLLSESMDRSAGIGFRCVADAVDHSTD